MCACECECVCECVCRAGGGCGLTMSSASRSLAMPSLLSEMSKAWPRGQGVGGVGGVQKAWLGQGVGVRV